MTVDERWLLTPIRPEPTLDELRAFGDALVREVDEHGAPTPHLLWSGDLDELGFGRLRFRGRSFLAHRLAFALYNGGTPPAPFEVVQVCGRRACCSPGCLRNGSADEQLADTWRAREAPDDDGRGIAELMAERFGGRGPRRMVTGRVRRTC